jgi:hypothetical protein
MQRDEEWRPGEACWRAQEGRPGLRPEMMAGRRMFWWHKRPWHAPPAVLFSMAYMLVSVKLSTCTGKRVWVPCHARATRASPHPDLPGRPTFMPSVLPVLPVQFLLSSFFKLL